MKKIIPFIIVMAVITSCNKDNDTETIPVNNADKIKTVTYGNKTTTYTYDQYGRQVLAADNDGSKIETSYTKGLATQSLYNATGVFDKKATIELNNDHLIKKMSYSDKPSNYTTYQYNSSGQVTKTISLFDAHSYYSLFYYSDGNLDSTQYYKNGARTLTNIMTYYDGQPNKLVSGSNGLTFYSTSSKFMMKSLTHVETNGNVKPENYSYEYDAKGRVIKLTEVSPAGTSTGYYTYE